MSTDRLDNIEAKAKLLGIQYKNLGGYGIVIHNDPTYDMLYLRYRKKPLKISKEICIPEYIFINGIIILRYAKKDTYTDSYTVYIRLYFPHSDKTLLFEEMRYISSLGFSDGRLPDNRYRVSGSDGCRAIVLKIDLQKRRNNTKSYKIEDYVKTYVISVYGYKKQISCNYISVANAGYDEYNRRRFVLLQKGMKEDTFESFDRVCQEGKDCLYDNYVDNNYINEVFTKYKLLSPSNNIVTK